MPRPDAAVKHQQQQQQQQRTPASDEAVIIGANDAQSALYESIDDAFYEQQQGQFCAQQSRFHNPPQRILPAMIGVAGRPLTSEKRRP